MSRASFGKIFAAAYHRSMRGSGPVVFAVWGYVLSHAEPVVIEGRETAEVMLNNQEVAFLIGCEEGEVKEAVEFLLAPDPNSQSKEREGRRLVRLAEFSYEVVNFMKYRDGAANSLATVKNRERWNRWKQRKMGKAGGAEGNGSPVRSSFTPPTAEEVVSYGDSALGMLPAECRKFWNYYASKGWSGMVDWKPSLANWKANERSSVGGAVTKREYSTPIENQAAALVRRATGGR